MIINVMYCYIKSIYIQYMYVSQPYTVSWSVVASKRYSTVQVLCIISTCITSIYTTHK